MWPCLNFYPVPSASDRSHYPWLQCFKMIIFCIVAASPPDYHSLSQILSPVASPPIAKHQQTPPCPLCGRYCSVLRASSAAYLHWATVQSLPAALFSVTISWQFKEFGGNKHSPSGCNFCLSLVGTKKERHGSFLKRKIAFIHRVMLSILEMWEWYRACSEFQYTYLSSQSHAKVMPPQLQDLGLKRNTSRAWQNVDPGLGPSLALGHKDTTSLDEKQGKKLSVAS